MLLCQGGLLKGADALDFNTGSGLREALLVVMTVKRFKVKRLPPLGRREIEKTVPRDIFGFEIDLLGEEDITA